MACIGRSILLAQGKFGYVHSPGVYPDICVCSLWNNGNCMALCMESEYLPLIHVKNTCHMVIFKALGVKVSWMLKKWIIHGEKIVVHARTILKPAVVLTFVSKYFMVLFPTMKTTNFYPLKMPTICYIQVHTRM